MEGKYIPAAVVRNSGDWFVDGNLTISLGKGMEPTMDVRGNGEGKNEGRDTGQPPSNSQLTPGLNDNGVEVIAR